MADDCPESVRGKHSLAERDGRCRWCRRKIAGKAPRGIEAVRSRLTDAYRRFYDPDWGSAQTDTDPADPRW